MRFSIFFEQTKNKTTFINLYFIYIQINKHTKIFLIQYIYLKL